MDTLAELTNQALSDHAGAAAQAARQLAEGLPGVLGAASAEELEAALRAIEHIGLGHLADADWTERQGALVAAEAARAPTLAPALARLAAAQALAAGRPPRLDELSSADQVRAHLNPALAATQRGDWAAARALMEQATACAEQDAAARRALAAVTHNLASHLRDAAGQAASPAPEAALQLMVDAARRSRTAWAEVGGWLEIERADWHLAMCHAVAGQGPDALRHAQATLAACQAHGADDFEFCFAWQAMAWAALSGQDLAQARLARDEMAARAGLIADPDFADYAQAELARLSERLGA